MRTSRVLWLAIAVLLTVHLTPPPAAAQSGDSLYKRLGGYDAIAAVVDDFIGRMIADPSLKRFFDPFSNDSKGRIRQHLVDQICAASGGPCVYTGRDMKSVHAGLGIQGRHFGALVQDLGKTLNKFKVPPREQKELVAILAPMRRDIVTR